MRNCPECDKLIANMAKSCSCGWSLEPPKEGPSKFFTDAMQPVYTHRGMMQWIPGSRGEDGHWMLLSELTHGNRGFK